MLESETKVIPDVKLKRRTTYPKWLEFKDLPDDLKQAIWLPNWASSLSDIIEADPKVQELMKEELSVVDWMEIKQFEPTGNSNNWNSFMWVPRELIERRNNKILDWYTMGIWFRTILHNINLLEKKRWWWILQTEKSVRKIIADYYTSIRPWVDEANVYNDSMREAAYTAHEAVIERLARVVIDKPMDAWKSTFEYSIVLEKLIQAHQLKIDNRWWNQTRANPITALQQNNQINIINQNVDTHTNSLKEESLQKLMSELDNILEGE